MKSGERMRVLVPVLELLQSRLFWPRGKDAQDGVDTTMGFQTGRNLREGGFNFRCQCDTSVARGIFVL